MRARPRHARPAGDLAAQRAGRCGRRRREPRPRRRRGARAPGAVREGKPGRAGCWSRRLGSATCGRWGRASTPASASTAARRRALGVAFGTGERALAGAARRPHDLTLRLEVNHWNGAVEPRVVLGELYPRARAPMPDEAPGRPASSRTAAEHEWWNASMPSSRVDPGAGRPSPRRRGRTRRREVVDRARRLAGRADRRACSPPDPRCSRSAPTPAGAAASPSGPPPPRASAAGRRCSPAGTAPARRCAMAPLRVTAGGRGLLLADWPVRWRARPSCRELRAGRARSTRCPTPGSSRSRTPATGFVHLAWGEPELDLALRVWELEWPSRHALAQLYRVLRDAAGDGALRGRTSRSLVSGGRAHPPTRRAGSARHAGCWPSSGCSAWEGTARRSRAQSRILGGGPTWSDPMRFAPTGRGARRARNS